MPMYTYKCARCGNEMQRLVPIDQRDEQTCDCSGRLERDGVELQQPVHVDGLSSSGAILSNGQRVRGDFGSERKRKGFNFRRK